MTSEQIVATKDAIEVLRDALRRAEGKYGLWPDASVPIWSAANYLWRSLPPQER